MDQVNEDKNIGDESRERKTEQGFTPGEWKANGNGVHVGTRCVAIAFDPNGRNGETAGANARLIAAAPALYERLKDLTERFRELDLQLCDDFEHPDDCDCEGEKARAVLTLVNAPPCLSDSDQVNDGQAS